MLSLALMFAVQTTQCQWVGSIWTCNTPQQPRSIPPIDYRPPAQPDAGESFRNAYQAGQAMRRQETRRKIGKLIADGNCKDAMAAALRSGDLTLAGEVRSLCE